MNELARKITNAQGVSSNVARLYQERLKTAQERFNERVKKAYENIATLMTKPVTPWDLWTNWIQYATDFGQRWVLFWDTIRKRGNNFIEHERAGKPPVLHFKYETVLDARKFKRPVNYALLKIVPPAGVKVDPKRRPYVIFEPRAGKGPGIGGFKDDSEVGVALRDGLPVYFVIFYPEPEPGQTLYDICAAEQAFVRKVRELHPDSPKPAIVGNCQGGWSAMMLAASDPEDMGPIVINGAPMSYWSGAWHEGEHENAMRYSGGLFGGSWLSSLAADLGNGLFDGAHLGQNFEYVDPATTGWDKYYNLFANVDTEPERFLQFDRWWGGFYLFSKRELEWIVQNLFVGNKLWSGDRKGLGGTAFDLREIKSPIILFASMGDNITPPEQAFNWVADTYSSTEEIQARGQVIVGLLHKSIGHLGIFVSGKVANKEHKEIVSVLKSIEALPPGLWGMEIIEHKRAGGKVEYEVEFIEHRLEDITKHVPLQRMDEKPFQLVAELSNFNQLAYELFAAPFVQRFSNQYTAELGRWFHPQRFQRWAFSDLNPWLAWLGPAAEYIKAHRQPLDNEQPGHCVEQMMAELISASLTYYRDVRDAMSEAMFFETYGTMFALSGRAEREMKPVVNGDAARRRMHEVKEALASINKGGYAEALSRAECLLSAKGKPIPLAQVEFIEELIENYGELLPGLTPYERRLIEGRQGLICRYAPEKALAALPQLLSDPADRRHFVKLLDAVEKKVQLKSNRLGVTAEQLAMLQRIRKVVSVKALSAAA
jgi:pimeloyl-ACP methyl ester carboxylesterase